MQYELFSYRYGREILEHHNFAAAWEEIERIIRAAPVFLYRGKSSRNRRLDIVQQALNAYFDRVFAVEHGWQHHPLATGIVNSQLKADFRKEFVGLNGDRLSIQTEVQFGNMARWYSDIFKFQAAYSQKLVQVGLSIIPMHSLGKRIDSNVVNFDRAKRELPSADLSITLPIVMVGVSTGEDTPVVDLRQCQFGSIKEITGRGNGDNLRRIVHAYLKGRPMDTVGPNSDRGPAINVIDPDETDELEESD